MVTRHHNHFLLKETYIFLDFVKSEGKTVKIQVNPWPKKDSLKAHEATFCCFSIKLEVLRPYDACKTCYLWSGLSIGGNYMFTRHQNHFLLKETYIFLHSVKSEWETVKIQVNPSPKNDFLKVHETTFLLFFYQARCHMTTWCM